MSRGSSAGNIRIDPLPVDLVAVIQGALDEVRLAAEAKGVSVTFTCHAVPDPVGGRRAPFAAGRGEPPLERGQVHALGRAGRGPADLERTPTRRFRSPIRARASPRSSFRVSSSGSPRPTPRPRGGRVGWVSGSPSSRRSSNGTEEPFTPESPGLGTGATFTVRIPFCRVMKPAAEGRRLCRDDRGAAGAVSTRRHPRRSRRGRSRMGGKCSRSCSRWPARR